jgi:hypothetical protein
VEGCEVKEIISAIQNHVEQEIKASKSSQIKTLKALIFSGYKGEREAVLLELLKTMGEDNLSPSPLIESFQSTFEDDKSVRYWRIKPEFYREVRRKIFQAP